MGITNCLPLKYYICSKNKDDILNPLFINKKRVFDHFIKLCQKFQFSESNFPVDKCAASYGTIWNAFKRVAAPYGRKQQRALFHGTAARVYSLSPADAEDERL